MRVPPTIWVTPPRCESGICCAATGRAASTSSATENGLIRAAAPAIGRRRRRPRRTPEPRSGQPWRLAGAGRRTRRPGRSASPRRTLASRSGRGRRDRKSTRLNSSHGYISYAVFCLKKKKKEKKQNKHRERLRGEEEQPTDWIRDEQYHHRTH